jgi:dipeptidyl-peptidase-4
LEDSQDHPGSEDVVLYNTETGNRTILVHAGDLIPEEGIDPLTIESYEIDYEAGIVIVFTNTVKVWRLETKGDYWIYNVHTKQLKQLGGNASPSTLMFATLSPSGNKVAYVVKNDLYVEDINSSWIRRLTSNGSERISNGTSDWVYEEEFGLRNGFRWSPDSEKLAFWQINADSVGTFYLINNTDSIYSKPFPVIYPKVGTTNSAVKIGIISVDGGSPIWAKISGNPRDYYIPWMDWAESSEELIIQKLNRLQNTNDIMMINANNGNVKNIFTDRDDAWLDVVDELFWIEGDSAFIWVSEKDGWRHIYKVKRNRSKISLLTPGNYDVVDLLSVDEVNGYLYFTAAVDDPTQRYLYRTAVTGTGKVEMISNAEQIGTHSYRFSPNEQWAFHSFSSFNSPPIYSLIKFPDHQIHRILVDNAEVINKVAELRRGDAEFFDLEIEENVTLDGYMIKPPDFDPGKKYPVLFFVYGEPWGQTARNRWGGSNYLWHLMLTQRGYIIINLDNRGTPAPRGRAWRKSVYRQIGILASADQAAAARIIRTWDFVDPDRIGIWGWSGGGSMSLNAIFRYPEIYSTAMAIAFVADQRYYDTIYQERYMGLPENNVEGYRDGSPINFAHRLKGNLLLIHGTADDNVHYQNTEALINELIEHNKIFTVVPYPNRTHSIRLGENTRRHLFETLTWYLESNMPPGPAD